MKIAKTSWHYRFNSFVQGYSFTDRVQARQMTTCSYIRTTMRSFFQKLLEYLFYTALCVAALIYIGNMLYTPIAIFCGFPVAGGNIAMAVTGWAAMAFFLLAALIDHYKGAIRAKLSERKQKQLNILEQRIKDGKDGICTIVELA